MVINLNILSSYSTVKVNVALPLVAGLNVIILTTPDQAFPAGIFLSTVNTIVPGSF